MTIIKSMSIIMKILPDKKKILPDITWGTAKWSLEGSVHKYQKYANFNWKWSQDNGFILEHMTGNSEMHENSIFFLFEFCYNGIFTLYTIVPFVLMHVSVCEQT